ncbi:MAG: PAS domain-containing protein [Deltaproteobacteria bacterium]|nr:PAS domain-containing protein [Deltaproteobacteria bacterium]
MAAPLPAEQIGKSQNPSNKKQALIISNDISLSTIIIVVFLFLSIFFSSIFELIIGNYFIGILLLTVFVLLGLVINSAYQTLKQQKGEISRLQSEFSSLYLSSLLLDNLLKFFPGSIYFKDDKSKFLRISRFLAGRIGVKSEEEVWGKSDHDMFSSEHADLALCDEQEIMHSRRPKVDFEEKETFGDGHELWVSTSKLPLYNNDKVIGTFGISLDVTMRKLAEMKAQREHYYLHVLMNNMPNFIYFKDKDCRFTNINKAHAHALGLNNPLDAIGKSDADFFSAEFAKQTKAAEKALMNSNQPLISQLEYDSRNNRWYLATKVPLKDNSGEPVGLVGVSTDITSRRVAEDQREKDLKAFLEVVNLAAKGDLTQRFEANDDTLKDIAQSVNHMLEGFAQLLRRARELAGTVTDTSSEILVAAQQIAEGAQHASEQVLNTSAASEELAMSMNEVSGNAEQSAKAANQVLSHLSQSKESVNAVAKGMSNINMTTIEMAKKMRLLEKRSKNIFDIIELIEDITDQSTLLSLNAAIAAARAGDAGRGFSVVAEEIRHLADRSSESAKQVALIVKGIVTDTKELLEIIERGEIEAQTGKNLSELAEQNLQAIQELVDRSVMLSEKIAVASREQALTTKTVSSSMVEMSNVTREASEGTNLTSNAVSSLVNLSKELERAIIHFKVS